MEDVVLIYMPDTFIKNQEITDLRILSDSFPWGELYLTKLGLKWRKLNKHSCDSIFEPKICSWSQWYPFLKRIILN